jgi:starvation-inducible DNA-binding protein
MSQTDTAVSSEASEAVVEDLDTLLADYQVLYQKLRAFHWNVEGPDFYRLHEKFEEIYDAVNLRVDDIAERIRGLGEYPTATYSEQLVNARLSEDEGRAAAEDMVRTLVSDLKELKGYLHDAVETAEDAGDSTTVNLLEEFVDEQEETIWMLKAYLGE